MYEALKEEFMDLFKLLRKTHEIFPKNEELTFMESMILHQIFFLSKNKAADEVTVSNLKSYFGFTNPAISQFLNTLEDKGYICRNIASGDRRSIALNITDKGMSVLKCNIEQTSAFLDQLIEKFGPENMKTMIDLFSQMTDVIVDIKHDTATEKR